MHRSQALSFSLLVTGDPGLRSSASELKEATSPGEPGRLPNSHRGGWERQGGEEGRAQGEALEATATLVSLRGRRQEG